MVEAAVVAAINQDEQRRARQNDSMVPSNYHGEVLVMGADLK
jgi:hypothetical protein